MGSFQVAISHQLAVEWPKIVQRSGCVVQATRLDSERTCDKAQLRDIKQLTTGTADYWATIVYGGATVELAFLKDRECTNPEQQQEDCYILPRGESETAKFLKMALFFMMLASGGSIPSQMEAMLKGDVLFRLAPESNIAFIFSAAKSQQISVDVVWKTHEPNQGDNTSVDRTMDSFCFARLSREKADVEIWSGPTVNPDGTFASFIAMRTKTTWRHRRKQEKLARDVRQLLSLNAQEVSILRSVAGA